MLHDRHRLRGYKCFQADEEQPGLSGWFIAFGSSDIDRSVNIAHIRLTRMEIGEKMNMQQGPVGGCANPILIVFQAEPLSRF
jgi:hypothetical protein